MSPNYDFLQELAQTEWHTLWRGRRRTDHQSVLLKLPRAATPSAADVERLAREYALLRELTMAGVPRALDFLRHDQQCCLALEDAGGEPITARAVDLDAFFPLALQLTTILTELHRRNITHNHLTPHGLLQHPTTGAVTLTDFSLATISATDTPLSLLRGMLAYSSPEQTGRMNRAPDYRSDFYALGVMFYEWLTGRLPFVSDDALELIHWHIAKLPVPPTEVNRAVPEPLAQIVMKLLAKTPEERYQSALGLQADLEVCAQAWALQRFIPPFVLGQQDVSDRFLIPRRLYGRAREVESLLRAFDRVCGGQTALLLVAGYSGIGKTSLIEELHKPIVRQRGSFVSGKFDQVMRSQPFSALLQAFRGLARQLLGESEEQLAAWRNRLTAALGVNGGVLTEVIPEIELIVGKQPAPPALGPTEALNRFQMVFQNFVAALARPEHPLVVFLDDLQWADAATLGLLQPLLTTPDIQSLFLMGAYRDNEVDASHPLVRTLGALEAAGGALHRIALGPLELEALTALLRDVLHGTATDAAPLARLVLEKTGGNPFFVTQFLHTLHQEGYLSFDYAQRRWTYKLEAIAAAPLTDNVIDLMTRKIQRLAEPTQRALTLAACIGNTFDQDTLAIVSEQTPEAAAADLSEAVNEGLILSIADCGLRIAESAYPTTLPEAGLQAESAQAAENPQSAIRNPQSYSFLHDRVQQAAYALIPAEWKQLVHLTVGRLLRARADLTQGDEKLFEVVHHLNLGSSLMGEEAEQLALAQLNLQAGRKAKSATAYEAALAYFQVGARLLAEQHWQSEYELALALQLEAAEGLRLCGNFDEAEAAYQALLPRARTKLDQARVYNLRMLQYENQSRYADALACGRAGLALLGVNFPDAASAQEAALEREMETMNALLGARSIASLLELPVMTDAEMRMVLHILTTIWSSAYIAGEAALTRLISATMVRLSLEHGNTEESAYGYATHAITVGPLRGDYAACYEFGVLALRVNEQFNDSRLRAKICQQFQAHVTLWRQPLHTCLTYAQEARRSGFENGDFTYGIYGAFTETWTALVIAPDLANYVREYTPNLTLFKKLKADAVCDGQKVMLNWARALLGETRAPLSLSDDEFDEDEYLANYRDNPFFKLHYVAAKLHLAYLLGEHEQALAFGEQMGAIVHNLAGMIWTVLYDFWQGLTLAANYADATEDERQKYLAEMQRAQAALAVLAENCAENYLGQSLLLAAEIARVTGREVEAIALYERALHAAEAADHVQLRALANELCGKFWLQREQPRIAAVFLATAREGYAQWRAHVKVAELERRYADLLRHTAPITSTSVATGTLDLFSVTKAAQAIAGEMDLTKLPAKLLRIAIENAGAERGQLLLVHDDEMFLHAEGWLDAAEVKVHDAVPLGDAQSLPVSVVNYVRRTLESVVLAEAEDDDRFAADPYIERVQPRSVMCVPVLNQGRLSGALYLENNQLGGAFTPARIQVMQVLAAQAAIALENARLYDEMKAEATQRREAEQTLRSIMEGTAAVTGGDFFASLVRHLSEALQVRYAFITECREQVKVKARMLAFWQGNRLGDNVTYDIAATPCLDVLAGRTCYYPNGVQHLFPNDKDLADLQADGYLGIPLTNAAGTVIGHLAVLDDKPMTATPPQLSLLNIFAARAGAELERHHAEAELRAALDEVERLKNQLHAENVYLQEEIRAEHNFDEIIGNSPALLKVLQQVEQVAPTDATVMILGETGTGKELIARAIHNRSPRTHRPLVKVNCGAISAGLVESELFGHTRGAFTGALDKRTGRFELADGGTLFLDEVGELSLETQVKLLRVLQEGEFEPVGSSKTVKVDVRIIAATNRNLETEVQAGRFRADLFYRLNVLPLHNPPLRERQADIPQLAMFFLSRYAKRFGKELDGIAQETMEALRKYQWPGNVRELQNLIERGVVLATGRILTLERSLLPTVQTPEPLRASASAPVSFAPPPPASSPAKLAATSLDDIARQHILTVLEQTNWVIEGAKGAAQKLNLHPNTLRSRMKKLGIQRPQ
jgi:predicted ATPase/transcriptional regulator with GAF, ATPase, and Fis domain